MNESFSEHPVFVWTWNICVNGLEYLSDCAADTIYICHVMGILCRYMYISIYLYIYEISSSTSEKFKVQFIQLEYRL